MRVIPIKLPLFLSINRRFPIYSLYDPGITVRICTHTLTPSNHELGKNSWFPSLLFGTERILNPFSLLVSGPCPEK